MSQLPSAPHNLPANLTPLIGRTAEYSRALELLRGQSCRLLSLIGPGGVGKTRLALECAQALAHQHPDRFPDGVYLVALADLSPDDMLPDLLATAIAGALGLSFSGPDTPEAQLREYLRARSLLLVIDNFEHFTAATPFLLALLSDAPALALLITSREALQLRGEWSIALEGLTFPEPELPHNPFDPPVATRPPRHGAGGTHAPPGGRSVEEVANYGAIQLFAQIGQMYDASFALTAENAPAVIQICQLIDGLPLGIELAASWLRTLSCAEVAAEIARGFDILASTGADLNTRQRSLRALFDSSWRLLSDRERQALGRLSLFRGSFTREAAAAVADVGLPVLAMLVAKSLLRRSKGLAESQASRYDLLELVRQYAAEHLEQSGEAATISGRHARYYAELLTAHVSALRGSGQQEALTAIGQELAQIRAAWHWACQTSDHALIATAADGLFHFYDMRSLFREGAAAFHAASTALAGHQQSPAVQRTWAHVLARHAWFIFHSGRQREAQALLEQSVAALRPLGAQAELVFSLNYLGAVCSYLGEYAATETLCHEALTIAQALDDRYDQAIASNILGQAAYDQGQYSAAQNWSQQSLALEQQLGNRWSMTYSLTNLGKVAFITGAYAEARWCFEESLQIRQALDDTRGVAVCLNRLGETAVALGAADEARERYDRSLALFRAIGSQWGVADALINRAHLALAHGDPAMAAPLLREALDLALDLESLPQVVTILATCAPLIRSSGDSAWADELDRLLAAAPITIEPYQPHARRLLQWAKAGGAATAPRPPAPDAPRAQADPFRAATAQQRESAPPNPAGLTAREIDVLRLVAQGMTDAQVADKLVVSRRTVSTHLSAIYGKLQINSRSAATRFAVESGLG